MVIERVHGLQATSISLNERFTMLAAVAPQQPVNKPRRRSMSNVGFFPYNLNFRNRLLIEHIARQLEFQARRRAMRQRIGTPQGNLRRFNSEGNLSNLRRSNSFGNLSQQSVKNRVAWSHSNGNLRRSSSFVSLAGRWRGLRRRGGQRALRNRFRDGWQMQGRVGQKTGVRRGRGQARTARGGANGVNNRGSANGVNNRGAIQQNQQQNKPVPTKEELDEQLDQYMANSKSALDKELDAYMRNAMELE